MPRADHQPSTSDLTSLSNLGPKSAAMLASVGITTLAQLRERGAIVAYAAVKRKHAGASLNLLYALVGQLENCDWKTVQHERKLTLMLALEDYQREHLSHVINPTDKYIVRPEPVTEGNGLSIERRLPRKQSGSTGSPRTESYVFRGHVSKAASEIDELSQLRNIGKAMRADFDLLGIQSVTALAKCNADELYARIQTLTQHRHDPCVWDTYAAAIHQAKTGEALAWWEFTKVRKERQSKGTFATQAPSLTRGRGQTNAAVRTDRIAPTAKQNPLPALSRHRERERSTKR